MCVRCVLYNVIFGGIIVQELWGCGTVAARLLCMQKVRGSIPLISIFCQSSNGHVFDSRWVLSLHL